MGLSAAPPLGNRRHRYSGRRSVERLRYAVSFIRKHSLQVAHGFRGKAKGPRSYTVAAMINGEQVVVTDCTLWVSGDNRALLVPRDRACDVHFAIGSSGLERRPGRPAASLAAGTIRAANRLVALARTSSGDGVFGVGVIEPLAAWPACHSLHATACSSHSLRPAAIAIAVQSTAGAVSIEEDERGEKEISYPRPSGAYGLKS